MAEPVVPRLTDAVPVGALMRVVRRKVVEDVLAETGVKGQRVRRLPAHVVVYFVMGLTLFQEDYEEILRRLAEGLRFMRVWRDDWTFPMMSALCATHLRLGEKSMRVLFERMVVPLTTAHTVDVWCGAWRLMAIDGVMQVNVSDTAENDETSDRPMNQSPGSFPQVRVMELGECGTHAVVATAIGDYRIGERELMVELKDYLAETCGLCDDSNTLFIADEVQFGLARTGATLALDHVGMRANLYTLGKSLNGGLLPLSAVIGRVDVVGVITPGDHGSTFGGNPMACVVGLAVVRLLATGEFQDRSCELGAYLHSALIELDSVSEVRGRGLWAGVN